MALAQHQRPLEFEDYVGASSLAAALQALADGRGTPVAGATDLWILKDLDAGRFGRRLVNIRRVREIEGIGGHGAAIRVGALATISEIRESPLLKSAAPVLPEAADRFGSVQIRNAATIGGNIANASPAADMVIPLLCLDAEVEVASWHGHIAVRRVPLQAMFRGPGQTCLEPNELITAVWFDRPAPEFHAVFRKSGPRPALEIARVSMCLAGRREGTRLRGVRIAFGAVAPTPLRCVATEGVLEGVLLDDRAIAGALAGVEREIAPIDDVRASAWYRRHLARTYLEQELRHVAQG